MKKSALQIMAYVAVVVAISGIGISFAWFVGGLTSSGSGGSLEKVTKTVGNTTLTSSSVNDLTNNEYFSYPGGMGVVAQKTDAVNADTENGYVAAYAVMGTITNNTGTNLTWELYRTTSKITAPFSTACSLSNASNGTKVEYYYSGCVLNSTITGTSNANRIGNGTTSSTTTSISVNDSVTLAASGSQTYYYYLVVSYPHSGDQTSAGSNKSISVSLTGTTAQTLTKS